MQISPSAALFQALSSISQPQGQQAAGANAVPLAKASKQAAETQTPQAVPAPQNTGSELRFREPAEGETPLRGSLLDVSA